MLVLNYKQYLYIVSFSFFLLFVVNDLGMEGCKILSECIQKSSLPWCRINLNGKVIIVDDHYRESYS